MFVIRRSTTTSLLEFTSLTIDGFRNAKQTDVIYTDFSKAFDSVNHTLLLIKLSDIGFPPLFLCWIREYLTDRTQKVLFKSSYSNSIHVTSGVPQGSHLGPLLFTLFINDLPSAMIHSRVIMYADDVKLCFSYKDMISPVRLQADLNNFESWCRLNLLNLNTTKCKVITFHRTSP